MKVALITDTHFGVRNDSPAFLANQRQFYDEVFFPTIDEQNINQVIHFGDVFDRRKYVNFNTLNQVRRILFDRLAEREIQVYMFVGNHDVYYKNTNEVNSIDLLLESYSNIDLVTEPREIWLTPDDSKVVLCPWINSENIKDTFEYLKNVEAKVLMGHFEINGFMMHRDTVACKTGLKREVFSRFEQVYTGHFHEPSTDGQITYLGAPSEYTWSDYGCRRGFNIYDTTTMEIEHVVNPHQMHYRFFADADFDYKKDWSYLRGKIVRIIVSDDVKKRPFQKFIEGLDELGLYDLEIIDNSSYHLEDTNLVADEDAIRSEDTMTIVESYVDINKEEIPLDPERLKKMFKQLYLEAVAMEQ